MFSIREEKIMSTNITTATFKSNLKKSARLIQKEKNVDYNKALNLASQEYGFDSYHALQTRQKNSNNESNISNPNIGTNGVNKQYSQSQGNRGKQLNPNQMHSLVIAMNQETDVSLLKVIDGRNVQVERVSFQREFLDKGFLEKIGARKLSIEEIKNRKLNQVRPYQEHLLYLEFARSTPWEREEAFEYIRSILFPSTNEYSISSIACSERIWLDNNPIQNFNYDPERFGPGDYCSAIDGYHDSY